MKDLIYYVPDKESRDDLFKFLDGRGYTWCNNYSLLDPTMCKRGNCYIFINADKKTCTHDSNKQWWLPIMGWKM